MGLLNWLRRKRPGPRCNMCLDLNWTIARERELALRAKQRKPENAEYLPDHLERWEIISDNIQNFKKFKSSNCDVCKFLDGVIDTFVPDHASRDRFMVVDSDKDRMMIDFRVDNNPITADDYSRTIEIYRPANSVSRQTGSAHEYIPLRPDINSPHSQESFDFLKSCLRTCTEEHDLCKQNLSPPSRSPPRRLLYVGSPEDGSISLFETHEDFREPYVALSYCWGKGVFFKTTDSNIQLLMRGFSLAQLPATIQDAVYITRKLKLEYIWVDALCIIQDNLKDWEQQSAKMCSIYEQAYLTIAASSAASADTSFLKRSSQPLKFQRRIDDRNILAARALCTNGCHYDSWTETPEPLLTRGWTLQESILATRTISYSTSELQWQCRSSLSCQCEQPNAQWLKPTIHTEEGLIQWDKIVYLFTQRQLTCPKDKLPAISGVCQLVHKQTKWRYLAGLWEDRLLRHLLWSRVFRPEESAIPIPSEYRAPSFSWASVDCPVDTFRPPYGFYEAARLVDSAILLSGADPFGRVEPGSSLTMEGKLIENVEIRGPDEDAEIYEILCGNSSNKFMADSSLEAFDFKDLNGLLQRSLRRSTRNANQGTVKCKSRSTRNKRTVSLFLLGHSHENIREGHVYFLVLSVSPSNRNAYERIGTWESWVFQCPVDFCEIPDRTVVLL
ncbi:hypothetical protein AAE478_002507 [Parahypoxylon ruwenzoriense]